MHENTSRRSSLARWTSSILTLIATVGVLSPPGSAQRASQPPPNHAITNVRLEPSEDGRRATLVLRGGRIAEILPADATPPADVRPIDGSEWLCLPTFIDAYTTTGVETPEPKIDQDDPLDVKSDVRADMRLANRKGIQPAFMAVEAATLDEKRLDGYRSQGFGYALEAPSGQLLAGQSGLVELREAALRDRVLAPAVATHAAFEASGGGYPSTLMGYHAQLRQFFLDCERQAELIARRDDGRSGARPAFDPGLEAGLALMSSDALVVCEAERAKDMRRWLRLFDEIGEERRPQVAFQGGREAWKLTDELKQRGTRVWLSLDWGDEVDDPFADDEDAEDAEGEGEGEDVADEDAPEDGDDSEAGDAEGDDVDAQRYTYTRPLEVRALERSRWEESRDCALRLSEVGVEFAFGTAGRKPENLLENVRTIVEAGLPRDAAQAALTTTPARWLGLEGRIGEIAAGQAASITLWSSDPLEDEDAKIAWVFVEGYPWKPAPKDEKDDEKDNDDEREVTR